VKENSQKIAYFHIILAGAICVMQNTYEKLFQFSVCSDELRSSILGFSEGKSVKNYRRERHSSAALVMAMINS
jgi:hypothetical protein